MPAEGAQAVRVQLQEACRLISELPAGKAETGVQPFQAFRRGVLHAASGRDSTPDELLSELEPKATVWRFLIELHGKKRMYSRQVAAVLQSLAVVSAWLDVLKQDEELKALLSEDLSEIVGLNAPEAEIIEEPPPSKTTVAAEPAAAPAEPPSDSAPSCLLGDPQPLCSFGGATEDSPSVAEPASTDVVPASLLETPSIAAGAKDSSSDGIQETLAFIQRGKGQIEALEFSAYDVEKAVAAFETFRMAVSRVVHSVSTKDDDVLEQIEPKLQLLEFLVDLHQRKRLYRSRVNAALISLLGYDGWRDAAKSDPSILATVRDLMVDAPAVSATAEASKVESVSVPAKIPGAKPGDIGTVSVRVVAAYNLINTDSGIWGVSDPLCQVSVGRRQKRTEYIGDNLNPTWNADPFFFPVPTEDTVIKLEVIDWDYLKEDALGIITLAFSDFSGWKAGEMQRMPLEGVPNGELEFQITFANH